jgi:uncharacterized protein (TIGR02300 family)
MAKGLKRVCTNCGTHFYDMEKRPIICPKCGTEFTGEAKIKGRRTRTAEGQVKASTASKKLGFVGDDEDDLTDAIFDDENTIGLDELDGDDDGDYRADLGDNLDDEIDDVIDEDLLLDDDTDIDELDDIADLDTDLDDEDIDFKIGNDDD